MFKTTHGANIMNQHLTHKTHQENKPRIRHLAPRHKVESMLREIAFVLKMTEKVRQEIEAAEKAQEPALV